MASLKNIKSSISELSNDKKVSLILDSRARRNGFYNKPDKRSNKKLISKLSQEQKRELLKVLNKES